MNYFNQHSAHMQQGYYRNALVLSVNKNCVVLSESAAVHINTCRHGQGGTCPPMEDVKG